MDNPRLAYIFFLVFLFFLSSCSTIKHNPCKTESLVKTKLNENNTNETVCFRTIDSYDLSLNSKSPLTIFGKLTFPKIKKKKYSAIILTHGAGGIRRYHSNYIDLLNNNGYVVFQIDHYTSRNIRWDKTFTKISGITFMIDAFHALRLLKSHPLIDKIGYIGWSQGGVGPILSHFPHVTEFINGNKFKFDAAVSIYPYCGFTFPDNSLTGTPLLMITGQEDMLTPEQACRNLYSKFYASGGKINHLSLEDAHHGFDNPFLYFGLTIDRLPSLIVNNDACTLTISNDGRIITLTKKDVSTSEMGTQLLNNCSVRGVKVKYNSKATQKAEEIILNFFKRNSL